MQLTLSNLKNAEYNGIVVTLCGTVPPNNRICVKLPCGKRISVPYSSIDPKQLEHIPTCAICMYPCFPGYSTQTSCKHVFHPYCLHKWRESANNDVEAPGTRCPLCRSYQGTVIKGCGSWYETPAMELVVKALGAICQNYASVKNLREPSQSEEFAYVMSCMMSCRQNGQNDYDTLQTQLIAFKANPKSYAIQQNLLNTLKATLIMHVFHHKEVDDKYIEAIDGWLRTL